MVIFLQFTLIDFRSLIGHSENLLTSPSWPFPRTHEFMRGSGPIIQRSKMGIDNWIGENYICNLKRGMKIDTNVVLEDLGIEFKNVSKHQYSSEDYILTKYEFVFVSNAKISETNYLKLQRIISSILLTKIRIRNESYKYTMTTFEKISKAIKTFHLVSSSKKAKLDIANQIEFVRDCPPQFYFYLNSKERLKTNGRFIKPLCKENLYHFNLYGLWHNYNNKSFRIWIHQQRNQQNNNIFDRELRISFLRFHSEYEALKIVFKGINEGKIQIDSRSTQSSILQKYFNRAISTILKNKKKISDKSREQIDEYYKNLFLQFQPGELDHLKIKINELKIRPQIEQKVYNFIANHIEKIDMKLTQDIKDSQIINQENNGKTLNTFNFRSLTGEKEINFEELSKEIAQLKSFGNTENAPDNIKLKEDINQMEIATQNKDSSTLFKHLETWGKWILDVGTKITIPIVVEIIKSQGLLK